VKVDRHLIWDGCFNARDLGGVKTADGGETHWGAVVRSDSPDHLTTAEGTALQAHGIPTIIDLRDDVERATGHRPAELTTVHLPLETAPTVSSGSSGTTSSTHRTPIAPPLDRWPQRFAATVGAATPPCLS
jgi:protein-tyrosine phosphatase